MLFAKVVALVLCASALTVANTDAEQSQKQGLLRHTSSTRRLDDVAGSTEKVADSVLLVPKVMSDGTVSAPTDGALSTATIVAATTSESPAVDSVPGSTEKVADSVLLIPKVMSDGTATLSTATVAATTAGTTESPAVDAAAGSTEKVADSALLVPKTTPDGTAPLSAAATNGTLGTATVAKIVSSELTSSTTCTLSSGGAGTLCGTNGGCCASDTFCTLGPNNYNTYDGCCTIGSTACGATLTTSSCCRSGTFCTVSTANYNVKSLCCTTGTTACGTGCCPLGSKCTDPYSSTGCTVTISSSAKSPTSSSSSCFAGTERVTLESGVSKAMAEVKVGDRVLTVNAKGYLPQYGVYSMRRLSGHRSSGGRGWTEGDTGCSRTDRGAPSWRRSQRR
jgi:hypothetical protein